MSERKTLPPTWALLLAFSACASQQPHSWRSTDPYLENANTKLEGRVAWIQFVNSRPVEGARQVSVGTRKLTWRAGGANRYAPIESVLRIGIEPKRRTGRELAVLLGMLAVTGFAGGSGGSIDDLTTAASDAPPGPIERFVAPLPGEIVWEARSERPSALGESERRADRVDREARP